MKIRQALLAAAASVVLLIGLGAVNAQTTFPSGEYTFEFSGDASVWDVSGTYDLSVEGIDMVLTVNVDPKGKITGSGHASVDAGGVDLNGNLTVTGSVTRSGAITRVALTVKMTGTVYYEGRKYKFSVTENAKTTIDALNHQLTGTATVKVSVAGQSASEKVDFDLPFDGDIDGSWVVAGNLNSDTRGRITGTGIVDVCGGKTFSFAVSGSFSAKKGLANLSFKGLDAPSKAVSLRMTVLAAENALSLKTMTASMLGQKVARK